MIRKELQNQQMLSQKLLIVCLATKNSCSCQSFLINNFFCHHPE
ncbi:SWIM zinc finger family protein [Lactococcus hodotermopsidis]